MTTVLVVGASGILGREVVAALREGRHNVVRTSRVMQTGWRRFDAIMDPPSSLFEDPVDLVVNCAAVLASEIDDADPSTIAAADRVNACFPRLLAEEAAQNGARLIHISTDAVFA